MYGIIQLLDLRILIGAGGKFRDINELPTGLMPYLEHHACMGWSRVLDASRFGRDMNRPSMKPEAF